MKSALSILLLLLAWPASAIGPAYHYVRPTAQGGNTGADWNNAWSASSLNWSAVGAGDTIWLAGGTYSGRLQIGASGTSGNRISILRATAGDAAATGAAGWDPSFDAQVIFQNLDGLTIPITWNQGSGVGSYVTLDGRQDSGIQLYTADSPTVWTMMCLQFYTGCSGVTLTNLEFVSCGGPSGYPFVQATTGIYIVPSGGGSVTGLTVTHCRFHAMVQAIATTAWSNSTFEHNKIYDLVCTVPNGLPIQHDNNIWASGTSGITWRWNEIWNWSTEGILLSGSGNGQWDIYGNVWHDGHAGATSRTLECDEATSGPIHYFNNTVANVWMGVRPNGWGGGTWTSDSIGENNIYVNLSDGIAGLPQDDYDLSDGSLAGETHGLGYQASPFVGGGDYHLSGHTTAGVALGAPYNVDPDGTVRLNWDRGAYEYAGGGSGFPLTSDGNAGGCSITNLRNLTATGTVSAAVFAGAGTNQFDPAGAGTAAAQAATNPIVAVARSGSAADLGIGTLADARLSGNVPLLNGPTNIFSGWLQALGFLGPPGQASDLGLYDAAGNKTIDLNGTNGTGAFSNLVGVLNATNLSGTVADARLSANVALLNANDIFSTAPPANGLGQVVITNAAESANTAGLSILTSPGHSGSTVLTMEGPTSGYGFTGLKFGEAAGGTDVIMALNRAYSSLVSSAGQNDFVFSHYLANLSFVFQTKDASAQAERLRVNAGGIQLATNAVANWPSAPATRGGCAFVNSNATVYLLTSTPNGTSWAATNKIGGP